MKLYTIFEKAKSAYPQKVRIVRSEWQLLPVLFSSDAENKLVLTEFPCKQEAVTHWDYTITLDEIEQQGGEA